MQTPVFVINVRSQRDRAEYMTRTLGAMGVKFRFFPAVDQETLDGSAWEAWVEQNPEWPFRRGDLACLRSHMATWRVIRDGADPFALIMEDDVVAARDLAGLLADTDWIPPDADIVKLETHLSFGTRIDRRAVATRGACRVHRLRGRHLGAAAYLLSRAAADALLRRHVDRSVDYFLFDDVEGLLDELNVYQVVPAPCVQGSILTNFGGGPADAVFATAIKVGDPPGRKKRRPRPALTEPVRQSLFLSTRLKLPNDVRVLEGRLRLALFRGYWRLRGQTMGPIPHGGGPIVFGARRKS